MREDELLHVTNHHLGAAPSIQERPGRYLGYFVNKFGEQLVFVHDDGEPDATVFLGDVDWEPRRVTDAGGLPDAGDLVLNDGVAARSGSGWPLSGVVATVSGERRSKIGRASWWTLVCRAWSVLQPAAHSARVSCSESSPTSTASCRRCSEACW